RAIHGAGEERREHRRERAGCLAKAVVARREVGRVQRQEQPAEDPRHDRAEPVDRRVAEQLLHARQQRLGSDPGGVRPLNLACAHAHSIEAYSSMKRSATLSRSWTCSTYARPPLPRRLPSSHHPPPRPTFPPPPSF